MTWKNSELLDVRGIKLQVAEKGEGQPLLFLHSGVSPTIYSDNYLSELAKTYRVIAPSHPGFGQSGLPRHFTSVNDLAYFYLDFLDAMSLNDVILIGASFGGWIAAELTVRSTSRISHLVLAAPFGIKVSDRETRDIADFYAVPQSEWPALSFHDPARWSPDYTRLAEPELLEVARGRETMAFLGWSPFMHNRSLRFWLHRIDVPTLIVRGKQDRIIGRDYAQSFVDEIAGARLLEIDGAGHFPHIEKARDFADGVRSLVADRRRAVA